MFLDWHLRAVGDDAARERLVVDFESAGDLGEARLRARFGIHLRLGLALAKEVGGEDAKGPDFPPHRSPR